MRFPSHREPSRKPRAARRALRRARGTTRSGSARSTPAVSGYGSTARGPRSRAAASRVLLRLRSLHWLVHGQGRSSCPGGSIAQRTAPLARPVSFVSEAAEIDGLSIIRYKSHCHRRLVMRTRSCPAVRFRRHSTPEQAAAGLRRRCRSSHCLPQAIRWRGGGRSRSRRRSLDQCGSATPGAVRGRPRLRVSILPDTRARVWTGRRCSLEAGELPPHSLSRPSSPRSTNARHRRRPGWMVVVISVGEWALIASAKDDDPISILPSTRSPPASARR